MVIPDADIWIDLLNDATLPSSQALRALVDAEQAALVGLTLSEILRGARAKEEARIARLLQHVPYIEMSQEAWRRAGRLAGELDRKGTPIPMTDVFLASITLELNHELFTRDKHFERIPGLRLYKPEGGGDA